MSKDCQLITWKAVSGAVSCEYPSQTSAGLDFLALSHHHMRRPPTHGTAQVGGWDLCLVVSCVTGWPAAALNLKWRGSGYQTYSRLMFSPRNSKFRRIVRIQEHERSLSTPEEALIDETRQPQAATLQQHIIPNLIVDVSYRILAAYCLQNSIQGCASIGQTSEIDHGHGRLLTWRRGVRFRQSSELSRFWTDWPDFDANQFRLFKFWN